MNLSTISRTNASSVRGETMGTQNESQEIGRQTLHVVSKGAPTNLGRVCVKYNKYCSALSAGNQRLFPGCSRPPVQVELPLQCSPAGYMSSKRQLIALPNQWTLPSIALWRERSSTARMVRHVGKATRADAASCSPALNRCQSKLRRNARSVRSLSLGPARFRIESVHDTICSTSVPKPCHRGA